MVPTFYAALVTLFGLFASRTGVLRLQVLCLVLGGTTAILLPALGGSTIVVPVMCLPFLVVRAWLESYGSGAMRQMPKPAFWLCCTVLWGLVCTLFLPRIFEGQVEVMTLDTSGGETGTRLIPIRPVSGNITQSVFAVGNIAMFLSARYLMRTEKRLIVYRDAVLMLAALNCAAAVINLGEFYAGFPPLLQYVRTAYAVFETGEQRGTGMMRIHGTFPETSAFSAFSLTLFGFTFNLWLNRVRPLVSGTLSLLLLIFLMFSTSGTAYAGIIIYGAILTFTLVRRGYLEGRIPRVALLVTGALMVLTILGALVLAEAPIAMRVANFFQVTVVNKMESESGETRAAWNHQAWQNFIDTYGLGVGIGTARASSFLLVLLSNVGVLGTLLYGTFLWHVLRPPPRSQGTTFDQISQAARHAVLASLSAALLSGTAFDRGPGFYLYAAAATLRARRSAEERDLAPASDASASGQPPREPLPEGPWVGAS
jgi:hypothetical protein